MQAAPFLLLCAGGERGGYRGIWWVVHVRWGTGQGGEEEEGAGGGTGGGGVMVSW